MRGKYRPNLQTDVNESFHILLGLLAIITLSLPFIHSGLSRKYANYVRWAVMKKFKRIECSGKDIERYLIRY